jgi:hypothetical protein
MRHHAGAVTDVPTPVHRVVGVLLRHPFDLVIRRWNWKAALLSALSRGSLFFGVNATAGLDAAVSAWLTEFVFRGTTAGCYGAVTQAFRLATPAWLATVTAMVLLPLMAHSLELVVHWLRGTTHLVGSISASVLFTLFTTSFNLFAMKRGALIVGQSSEPLWRDLVRVPRLLLQFSRMMWHESGVLLTRARSILRRRTRRPRLPGSDLGVPTDVTTAS